MHYVLEVCRQVSRTQCDFQYRGGYGIPFRVASQPLTSPSTTSSPASEPRLHVMGPQHGGKFNKELKCSSWWSSKAIYDLCRVYIRTLEGLHRHFPARAGSSPRLSGHIEIRRCQADGVCEDRKPGAQSLGHVQGRAVMHLRDKSEKRSDKKKPASTAAFPEPG